MSQGAAFIATDAAVGQADDEMTTHAPLAVHSCSRLGRVANPPGFSFSDWFRSALRR